MEYLHHGMCEGMQHMSESVFMKLCQKVGTSEQVAIRRETDDFKEMVLKQVTDNVGVFILSGSRKEGFRLTGSDMDMMIWSNNLRVIMDTSQSEYYNTANATLILSDSSESPPGYTLLQLLTPTTDREVQSACVRMNDRVYISSSMFIHLTCFTVFPNSSVHGPCVSGVRGRLEYDTAHSFVCDFWPQSASSLIDRCHSWPDPEVVNDIVSNGCHFVAIGHPLGLHENEEWRFSFSQAEYKLVYSMNHSQFLTYGLLKIFLKEVINQESEETNTLLCSYHMKTTIFWAIQQNMLPHWCPQNLLVGFWVCFKLLLKWVFQGVCPNFFIPQNNLFLTKVHSSAQNRLFLQLYELYKKGLGCLLQSSSIRSYIIDFLFNPRRCICIDVSLRSEVFYDLELVKQCWTFGSLVELPLLIKALDIAEQLIDSHLSQYQVVTLQKLTFAYLQNIAFIFHNMYSNRCINKAMYFIDKMSCHMLKLAAHFGCVSDMLYIAMYYYKTLRFQEALSVIEMTRVKLAQPYLMYRGHVCIKKYIEAVGGQSWSTKMRQAVAVDIELDNNICYGYISELIPEQQCALQNSVHELRIPVFVMLNFLEFLCYRHINTTLSQASVDELQVLVNHDRRLYVPALYRDISWEILGICQQITGNPQAALYSYKQSLTQNPWHCIQAATEERIRDVNQ